jgi:hypothetical protein
MKPENLIGKWLRSSCRDEYDGRILSVGHDTNGVACLEYDCFDLGAHLHFPDAGTHEEPAGKYGFCPVTSPKESYIRAVLIDVQYKIVGAGDMIELLMPEGGCYRCTCLFIVKDGEPPEWFAQNGIPDLPQRKEGKR